MKKSKPQTERIYVWYGNMKWYPVIIRAFCLCLHPPFLLPYTVLTFFCLLCLPAVAVCLATELASPSCWTCDPYLSIKFDCLSCSLVSPCEVSRREVCTFQVILNITTFSRPWFIYLFLMDKIYIALTM